MKEYLNYTNVIYTNFLCVFIIDPKHIVPIIAVLWWLLRVPFSVKCTSWKLDTIERKFDHDKMLWNLKSTERIYRYESELRGFHNYRFKTDDGGYSKNEWSAVLNLHNEEWFETYVITQADSNNVICINGMGVRLACVGDKIVIMSIEWVQKMKWTNTVRPILLMNEIKSSRWGLNSERHLAGGMAARFWTVTPVVSKWLLCVYDKPLILLLSVDHTVWDGNPRNCYYCGRENGCHLS